MERRDFLKLTGAGAATLVAGTTPLQVAKHAAQHVAAATAPADITLHIAPVLVELGPGQTIATTGYNGQAPGPVLRMTEGKRTVVDVFNDTDVPELVHWHGQLIPSDVDGSAEEGTPFVPAHGHRRMAFLPKPPGTRWYHSHVMAGPDLNRGLYTGQFGFLYIDPKREPGQYDREVFLALREWQAYLTAEEEDEEDEEDAAQRGPITGPPTAAQRRKQEEMPATGLEAAYRVMSINDKILGAGEPIRVKEGERIMFRVLNASATDPYRISLPGHKFHIVAMDGNPVPNPQAVELLQLGPAERIDAIVEMDNPGKWVFGSINPDDRKMGMGVIVEYAAATGQPVAAVRPPREVWDYTRFGNPNPTPPSKPDGHFDLVFEEVHGGPGKFNKWYINRKQFPHTDPMKVHAGKRYRVGLHNHSDDAHPMHLHRHTFELVSVDHQPTAGLIKDTVTVLGYGDAEFDFVANNPGPTLFHCHMQIHMDFGLMCMVQYI